MNRDRLGRIIGLASELGLSMGIGAAGLLLLGLLAGRWLDAKLGTSPWATIALTVSGAVAGQMAGLHLVRRTTQHLREAHGADKRPAHLRRRDVGDALWLALRAVAIVSLPGLGGAAAGILLDRQFGSGFACTALLLTLGIAAGFAGVMRLVRSRRTAVDERG